MSSVYCMHRRYIVVFAIRNLNGAEGDYEPTVVCLERVQVQNAWRLGAVAFRSTYWFFIGQDAVAV